MKLLVVSAFALFCFAVNGQCIENFLTEKPPPDSTAAADFSCKYGMRWVQAEPTLRYQTFRIASTDQAQGIELPAQTICAQSKEFAGLKFWVACIDWPSWARAGLPVAAGKGPDTQVLVHAESGDVACATVDRGDRKETQCAPLTKDPWGRLVGMIVFNGATYIGVTVRVADYRKE